eukprot:2724026-Pyramimonas_sp.AAC.1
MVWPEQTLPGLTALPPSPRSMGDLSANAPPCTVCALRPEGRTLFDGLPNALPSGTRRPEDRLP